MKYTDNSERLLKYQKTKAKLIEYDVPHDSYPNFPINSNDLSFSAVYILSLYAESIIKANHKHQAELKPLLVKAAQYFDSAFESKDRLQNEQNYLVTGAVAYFLYNDFGSAKVLCSKLTPDISSVDTPFQLLILCLQYLLINKAKRFSSNTKYCIDIYNLLISYFRSGKEDSNIISLLSRYREYISDNGNALDSFYVDLLYAVVIFAIQKSAWQLLPQYSGIPTEIWKSYLERHDSVKILWQSQELLCTHGVLKGQNAIIQLPTGVGKTKSIELIIRSAQLSNRTTEVIIVAPLRALCNEIAHDLQYTFRNDNVELNQFSDILEDDYTFDLLESTNLRISICTPEKLRYIIHHQPDICDMIDLFILDEAHMFDDGARGVAYEFLVTTIRERLNTPQQLILLSAVMTNANDIKQWLFGENGVLATDDSITSTPKSIGFCHSTDIAYYSGDPLSSDFFVPKSLSPQELQRLGRERNVRFFPEKDNARDIALYYGIRLCKNGGVAVYVDTTPSVRTTISRILDIAKRGYDLSNVSNNTCTTEMLKIQRLMYEYYGEDHVYSTACCYGILPHHSRLPNGIKLAVEYALRENMARFVVCTSTLAQGVNIPIKYLLMTGINKRNGQISIRAFQNLIGRTARSGMYTEGSVLITNPSLYTKRNTYVDGGKYRWNECCEMFSKSSTEPCKSSLLILVSNLSANYDQNIEADKLVQYIVKHYTETDCFEVLQSKIISAISAEQRPSNNESIIYQLSQRKQILEAIENYLCFVYETLPASGQDHLGNIGEEICKKTLAYHLANNNERAMLLTIFQMLEEKVASLSKQQHMRYSAAMTSINNGKAIEAWINDVDLLNHFYAESDMLHLLVNLYIKLYNIKMEEDELLHLCLEWIKGTMPLEMLASTSFMDIDQLLVNCHRIISYELSFLLGNIIDLLPEPEDEESESNLYSALSLLQKKLKYGVPTLTAISICESLFWDRYIAIEITKKLGNDSIKSSDLHTYLVFNKDKISSFLEEMPTFFFERFSSIMK